MNKRHVLGWLTLLSWVIGVGAQTIPANYPNQSIKLMVPWPAGGGVDTTARMIADPLAKRLGQPIVIDNRGGAGGNIGTEMAARSKPDGYNLLMGSITPNAINIHLYPKLTFDPIKDFTPITFVSSLPIFVVVPISSSIKTVADLLQAAKTSPGKLTYGSAGVGSSQHLAAVQFMAATKVEMLHVPYKGTAPAETDLMAGHISVMFDTATSIPFIHAGKLRALGVMSKKRNPALPNIPTLDEAGLLNLYASSWYGLMGPAGMSPVLVSKINAELNEVLRLPEVQKRMYDLGAEIGGGTPIEFANFIQSEINRYSEIVKFSGAKFD